MKKPSEIFLHPKKELDSLPDTYTLEMAQENQDIIATNSGSHRTKRLYEFMNHVELGIPDRIRIAKFGLDRPAIISILLYDGKQIQYITDSTRHGYLDYYLIHCGDKMIVRPERRHGTTLLVFYLITKDQKTIEVFYDPVGY